MKKFIAITIILLFSINTLSEAQSKAPDSVVINVGNGSKITIVIKDKKDLETLKSYNFQSLMDDLITKIESEDTTSMKPSASYLNEINENSTDTETNLEEEIQEETELTEESSSEEIEEVSEKSHYHGTRQSFNIDMGMNNYLSNGKSPDAAELYNVRPWGSFYIAMNSVFRSRLTRTFFLEWALGVSRYDFKFQNDAVKMTMDPNSVVFTEDTRDVVFKKSKLSTIYLNTSFIPVIDFGGNRRKPVMFDGHRSDSFRIGFGPYAGYRLDSHTKLVYEEDGDKEKDKEHNNFHMNNFRYGLRFQLGFKDTDLFFNYDLNTLFAKNKGPELNAISFGVAF